MNTEITDTNATSGLCGRVFYDADCALCVRLAGRFRGWLWRQGIDLAPLQASGALAGAGILTDDLLTEMRFLTGTGEVFAGAEAVMQIARRTWYGWPLFALSRVPGVMPALARLYRWIAQRRNCADGACHRQRSSPLAGWLPAAALPTIASGFKSFLPAWGFMWAMAFAIFFGCKWLTWWEAKAGRKDLRYALAYLLAWPGMDAGSFLRNEATTPKPTALGWCFAAVKALLGIGLIWGGVGLVQEKHPLLAGWVGLVGLAFLLHFGLFHLVALLWQRVGINAAPIMRAPILAMSLAEFWGKRWTRRFINSRILTHSNRCGSGLVPGRRPCSCSSARAWFTKRSSRSRLAAVTGCPPLTFCFKDWAFCLSGRKLADGLGLATGCQAGFSPSFARQGRLSCCFIRRLSGTSSCSFSWKSAPSERFP